MTTYLSGGETFVLKAPVAILGQEEQRAFVKCLARDIELLELRDRLVVAFHNCELEIFADPDDNLLTTRLLLSRVCPGLSTDVFEESCCELSWLMWDVIAQSTGMKTSQLSNQEIAGKIFKFCLEHDWMGTNPAGIHDEWVRLNPKHRPTRMTNWLSSKVAQ
jgi:hypothetical protein